tara:strand:- start:222 stop:968 length:747 start_codon:yes stop_codon:yes gene_type:complete
MNHSEIAKSGYANEDWLANLLTHWRGNTYAKKIIQHFGYDLDSVSDAYGLRLKNTEKTDVILVVHEYEKFSEVRMSCKKFSYDNKRALGHIAHGAVDNLVFGFGMDLQIRESLMAYAGGHIVEGKRGVYFDDPFFDSKRKEKIVSEFTKNYDHVFETIFKGKHQPPQQFVVTVENDGDKILFIAPIDDVIEYAKGDRRVWFGREESNHNLALGNITMYRKGHALQFKMDYRMMVKALGHKMRIMYIYS